MDATAIRGFTRANRLLLFFAALAVSVRLLFWFYTGRVWEDALISLTAARMLWEGHGLTHHISEPRVHSFTSALGQFVLILGEGFGRGQGLLAMRLTSLASAVAAIFFAERIGRLLGLHWAAQCLVLGYLALDHLQIFFGMAGMETQLATAVILANIYFYLTRRWTALGLACGAAVICRPEFAAWAVILGIALLFQDRRGLVRTVACAAAVALPWLVFAQIYYGSFIPHTIRAKSATQPPWTDPHDLLNIMQAWVHQIAPFREYYFVAEAPLPDFVLHPISVAFLFCAAVGAVDAVRRSKQTIAIVLLLAVFLAYRTAFQNVYFMWYLPPFLAILALFAGCGINRLAKASAPVAVSLAGIFLLAYAAHLPFTLELDRRVQVEVEQGIRQKLGRSLAGLMKPEDTVFLEPLGYIGWEIPGRTIYDFPGLTSPKALAAVIASGSMTGMVDVLRPDYLVLRPWELANLRKAQGGIASHYAVVEVIRGEPNLSWAGLRYFSFDKEFTILRRR